MNGPVISHPGLLLPSRIRRGEVTSGGCGHSEGRVGMEVRGVVF